MMTVAEWKQTLKAGKLDKKLKQLYGDDADMLVHQKKRYAAALDEFAKLYPQRKQVGIFSAPGRTEVGGNHTDHQHGCVLAAAAGILHRIFQSHSLRLPAVPLRKSADYQYACR